MTGATLCSGIGAPEVALPHIDWKFCAEIEKFPSAVLKHHRPDVPNLGDITADDFIQRALAFGGLDLLVAGTPCQAFSVAGNRQSLADSRGDLTLHFVEIINALKPRIVLWENVPGVLNTRDNAFGCFLGALVGAEHALVPNGRWTHAGVVAGPERTAAWRVLDAQHLGLAQRRKRVFVVAGSGDGPHPAEILFEREGVQRDTPPSREAGTTVTALTANGVGTCGADDNQAQGGHLIAAQAFGGGNCSGPINIGTALTHHGQRLDFDTETFVCVTGAVAFSCKDYGADAGVGIAPTLRSMNFDKSHINGGGQVAALVGMSVRRLTPKECERLQGFPDDFTLIPGASDTGRYKALGNSMAAPVIRWIGERIERELIEEVA